MARYFYEIRVSSSFSFIIFYYVLNNLKTNVYEVLFIDERMLIDDIYNLLLLEDLYGRFSNISTNIKKYFNYFY